jgi:RHS repeat-associated protein
VLTYDGIGRPAQRQIVTDQTYAFQFDYHADTGLPRDVVYPVSTAGYQLRVRNNYQYGLLQQAIDANTSAPFWTANALNHRGQVTQETLGNGVVTSRAFDAVTGWVSTMQSGVGGGASLQNESYLRDLVGNVTQRQNNNAGLSENFYYDNLYRLDYSQLTVAGNTTTNLDLGYDAMGNITSRSDIAGGAAWTYHPTKKHAVTQAGSGSYTYAYDANGNATSRFGQSVTWSSYNFPTQINGPGKTLSFLYDAHRNRYRQTYTSSSGTETAHYVGGLLEKVVNSSGTDWRHYVNVGGQVVAVISRHSNGTNLTRYMLEDQQGSPSHILNANGTSFVQEAFSAFGQRRDAATWQDSCLCDDLSKIKSVSRRGYTAHEAIGGVSMGLNHMNGRVQDAITGRFLSADPYVTEPGNTQGFNRYAYVSNNPMTYIDPSGFVEAEKLTCTGFLPAQAFPGVSMWNHMQACELVAKMRRKDAPSDRPACINPYVCRILANEAIEIDLLRKGVIAPVTPDTKVDPADAIEIASNGVAGAAGALGLGGKVINGWDLVSRTATGIAHEAGNVGNVLDGGKAAYQVYSGDYSAATKTVGRMFVERTFTMAGGTAGAYLGKGHPAAIAIGRTAGGIVGVAAGPYLGPPIDNTVAAGGRAAAEGKAMVMPIVGGIAAYMDPLRFVPRR